MARDKTRQAGCDGEGEIGESRTSADVCVHLESNFCPMARLPRML